MAHRRQGRFWSIPHSCRTASGNAGDYSRSCLIGVLSGRQTNKTQLVGRLMIPTNAGSIGPRKSVLSGLGYRFVRIANDSASALKSESSGNRHTNLERTTESMRTSAGNRSTVGFGNPTCDR
jgi:hypothetical protein